MATTEDRLQEVRELEELWRGSPEAPTDEPRPERARRLRSLGWGRGLQLAWLFIFGSFIAFQPAPADPTAAVPLWVDLAVVGFMGAMVAGFIGMGGSRRWGFIASGVAGIVGMGMGAACLATEHHLGLYGAYEIAGFTALTALSAVGLTRAGRA